MLKRRTLLGAPLLCAPLLSSSALGEVFCELTLSTPRGQVLNKLSEEWLRTRDYTPVQCLEVKCRGSQLCKERLLQARQQDYELMNTIKLDGFLVSETEVAVLLLGHG